MNNSAFKENCLQDRIVLITGGAGAIGRAIVTSLRAHGATVAVNDIVDEDVAAQTMDFDDKVKYFKADITDEGAVFELFDAVEAVFGTPNVVCCHAGIVISSAYTEMTLASFEKTLDINMKGSFLISREGARRLVGKCSAERQGRIIFTSSWVQDVPWPEIAPYSASKSGINMLMKTLAREMCDKHILVNSVVPGIVGVGMAKQQWDTDPDYKKRASKAIPLGFLQTPETVADAFVFLASDASRYMTGVPLLVDGGCSLYPMDD
jgi:NAD(P)-dependent dehydrogenase (short-subunit alcohol dehydrogenase family)